VDSRSRRFPPAVTGSTTGWTRQPGGGSVSCWARPGPDDPPPVFVRPEAAVEVTFLGWSRAGSGILPTAA
jgi:hypothetical protein